MHGTYVDDDIYVFQARLKDSESGTRTPILVIWLGTMPKFTQRLRTTLRAQIEENPQCTETWFVYPAHQHKTADALLNGSLGDRLDNRDGYVYRSVAVDASGSWIERAAYGDTTTRGAHGEIAPSTAAELRQDGLRQLFRDADALFVSGSSFHFVKPGGTHSTFFLRAGETATRNLHASFVAASLLPVLREVRSGDRFLADTAGIHPILFHLASLLQSLRDLTDLDVDSFGGYEEMEHSLRTVTARDHLFISSSTSGSLVRKISQRLGARTPPTVVTLFYLGATPPTDGEVLCDLTFRGPEADHRTAGVASAYFKSQHGNQWKAGLCPLCSRRVPTLQLAGDGFLPRPEGLELRLLTRDALDTEYIDDDPDADTGDVLVQQDFLRDFYGLGALMVPGHIDDGEQPRTFSTDVAALLDPDNLAGEIVREELLRRLTTLRAAMGGRDVSAIVYTADSQSQGLAEFFAAELFGEYQILAPRLIRRGQADAVNALGFDEAVGAIETDTVVIGVTAVVSSGRALLDLSRSLRIVPTGVAIGYLAAIGHPPSRSSWRVLRRTLRWTSPKEKGRFVYGWLFERDPADEEDGTPWAREFSFLRELSASAGDGSAMKTAFESRARELSTDSLDSQSLFVAPSYDGASGAQIRPINPRFIMWNFDHTGRNRHDGRVAPSQAEVFVSISHFLHRSRFTYSSELSGRPSARLPGFVLDPANFDRYNDPQIQSAILRCARPGELDYGDDEDASRAMAEIVRFALDNLGKQGGEAACEFLLSIAQGALTSSGYGLKLRRRHLRGLLKQANEHRSELGPYAIALIDALAPADQSTVDSAIEAENRSASN